MPLRLLPGEVAELPRSRRPAAPPWRLIVFGALCLLALIGALSHA